MTYDLKTLMANGIYPDPAAEDLIAINTMLADGKIKVKRGNPEEEFQVSVLKMAKLYGWKRAHFRPALTSTGRWITPVAGDGRGFPDLLLIHEDRKLLIVAELKYKASPSPEQKEWLRLFSLVGIPTYLWRPKHWDEIQTILSGEPHGKLQIVSGRYHLGKVRKDKQAAACGTVPRREHPRRKRNSKSGS